MTNQEIVIVEDTKVLIGKRKFKYILQGNKLIECFAIYNEEPLKEIKMTKQGRKSTYKIYEDKKGKYIKLFPNYKHYLKGDN